MGLVYRKVEGKDLKAIFELGKSHFGSPSQFSWDWSIQKLEGYLDSSFGTGIVCLDKELIGFALAQNKYSDQKPRVAWLTYGMADKKQEGKGIGSELYKMIIAALKEVGATEIIADVYEDNAESLEFFEKKGFVIKEKWFILSRKL